MSGKEDKVKGKNKIKTLIWSVRLNWKVSGTYVIYSSFTTLFLNLISYINALINGYYANSINDIIETRVMNFTIIYIIVGQAVLSLVAVAFRSFSYNLKEINGEKIRNYMTYRLSKYIEDVPLENFESETHYKKIEMCQNGINEISWCYDSFIRLIAIVVTVVLMVITIGRYSIVLFFIVVLSQLPFLFIKINESNTNWGMWLNQLKEYKTLNYVSGLFKSKSAMKEMRVFGCEDFFINKLEYNRDLIYKRDKNKVIFNSIRESIGLIINNIGNIICYGIAIYLFLTSHWEIGDIIFLFSLILNLSAYTNSLNSTIVDLTNRGTKIYPCYEAFSNLNEDTKNKDIDIVLYPEKSSFEFKSLSFENVEFSYPNGQSKVLENVSFTIGPGTKIAIVGENGAGKTTLVKLLLGLYQPTKGFIFLNGIELNKYSKEFLYNFMFSSLFQDYSIFDMTLGENIAFEKSVMEKEIYKSMQEVGGNNVIDFMPEKLNTVLGKMFGDIDVSIGQKQTIGLARTHFHNRYQITLDEPTSALDAYNEKKIYDVYLNMVTPANNIIYITHRMATAKFADDIIVLKNGRIVEEGTHAELMRMKKEYYDLYSIQSSKYE